MIADNENLSCYDCSLANPLPLNLEHGGPWQMVQEAASQMSMQRTLALKIRETPWTQRKHFLMSAYSAKECLLMVLALNDFGKSGALPAQKRP